MLQLELWTDKALKEVEGICSSLSPALHPAHGVEMEAWRQWLDGFGGVPEKRVCPRCGLRMAEKNGKYGAFLGCTGYPGCTYTENK